MVAMFYDVCQYGWIVVKIVNFVGVVLDYLEVGFGYMFKGGDVVYYFVGVNMFGWVGVFGDVPYVFDVGIFVYQFFNYIDVWVIFSKRCGYYFDVYFFVNVEVLVVFGYDGNELHIFFVMLCGFCFQWVEVVGLEDVEVYQGEVGVVCCDYFVGV